MVWEVQGINIRINSEKARFRRTHLFMDMDITEQEGLEVEGEWADTEEEVWVVTLDLMGSPWFLVRLR